MAVTVPPGSSVEHSAVDFRSFIISRSLVVNDRSRCHLVNESPAVPKEVIQGHFTRNVWSRIPEYNLLVYTHSVILVI